MKVTAFHLINKIEETSQSYFSNSMIFSNQRIGTNRIVNFRDEQAGLTFYIDNGSRDENIEMGSISIETIQEKEDKIAFQCSYEVQPTGATDEFFMLLPSDREAYAQYMEFMDRLKKHWEKQPQHYLPSMEEQESIDGGSLQGQTDMDDEYEGLTPEEIEAVTGVRPGGSDSSSSPADDMMSADELAALTSSGEEDSSDNDNMSMDDLESLISSSPEEPETAEEAPKDDGQELSEDDIAAMLGNSDSEDASEGAVDLPPEEPKTTEEVEPTVEKAASTEGEGELEMSADDIWKQISGGQPMQ